MCVGGGGGCWASNPAGGPGERRAHPTQLAAAPGSQPSLRTGPSRKTTGEWRPKATRRRTRIQVHGVPGAIVTFFQGPGVGAHAECAVQVVRLAVA